MPIDFAHWFNLVGACLLLSFNHVFPKSKLNSIASVLTIFGVIAHIGLCTIDFIMWSFGDNDLAREALGKQIRTTPSVLYPFVIVGPSLLFVGLTVHACTFIKTKTMAVVTVIFSAVSVGFSFFILKNGIVMFLSCLIFVSGLGLLLFQNKNKDFTQKISISKWKRLC
ncbi:hypothetical protein CFS9_12520 [Flavobacterium sp. CFS9]|uniref:MerC mercury resistance protein n=2 Tax=Flavobacterium sp. CFS9 TaxID=3143118 RepID=A0AAT9GZD1_9FLAO